MTTEEVREIYDIAWGAHLVLQVLSGELRKHGDEQLAQHVWQFSNDHWQSLADATGQPVPDDMKRPRAARPVVQRCT